jgi:hypothetical protein
MQAPSIRGRLRHPVADATVRGRLRPALRRERRAMVDLSDGSRLIRGRAATEDERPRLWASWVVYNKKQDAYAALRSRQTQVVILEPRFD